MKPVVHQFEDKLLDFAYGELQPHEAEAVDAHVRGCTRCSESLSNITSVRTTMRLLPTEPAPAAGLESLLAYAEQHARQNAKAKPAVAWWRRLIVPLTSVMALVTVGVVAMQASYTPDPVAAAFETREAVPVQPEMAAKQEAPAPEPVIAAAPPPTAAAKPSTVGLNEVAGVERKNDVSDGLLKEAGPKPKVAVAMDAPLTHDYSNSGSLARREPVRNGAADAEERADVSEEPKGGKKGDVGSFGLQNLGTAKPAPAQVTGSAQASSVGSADFDSNYGRQAEVNSPAPTEDRSPSNPPQAAPSLQAPSLALGGVNSKRVQKTQANKVGADEGERSNDDEGQAIRSRVANVFEAQLAGARAASNRGDRQSEINECLLVLNGGAQGYQRAESLKRLCDAYDVLGQPDRAQAFCDSLASEFPQTAAAKQMVQRRSAGLRDAKAPQKKMRAPADAFDQAEQQRETPAPKPVKR